MLRQLAQRGDHRRAEECEVAGIERKLDVRQRCDDPVKQPICGAEEQSAFAGRSPREDHVRAGQVVRYELRNDFRLILQIRIHQNHGIAAGIVERGAKGGLVAEISGQHDDPDARIALDRLFEQLTRAIRTSVVDEHDFVRPAVDAVEDGQQSVEQLGNDFLLVVNRDPYRQFHVYLRPWKWTIDHSRPPKKYGSMTSGSNVAENNSDQRARGLA